MTPFHGSHRAVVVDDDTIVVSKRPGKRMTWALAALFLTVAAMVGLDPARDFSGNRLLTTTLIFGALLTFVLLAGFDRRIVADRRTRHCIISRRLFALRIGEETIDLSKEKAPEVVLREVEIMRSGADGEKPSLLAGYLTARTRLFRLSLETAERRVEIEETTYREEASEVGKALSDFLGLRFVVRNV